LSVFRLKEQAKQETSRSRWHAQLSLLPLSAGFLLGFLFNPENGGDVPPNHQAFSKLNTSNIVGMIKTRKLRMNMKQGCG
jgi:hypothetical protein